jgi:predicted phosphoribosyltransferase
MLPPGARFADRADAGRRLASVLADYAGRDDVRVLGLPRGGVPVAFEVARALQAPLDVYLVRKLGVPGHEELAMGAIASGGTRVVDERVVGELDIDEGAIAAVAANEQRELERRERLYREGRPPPAVERRVAMLVDDGLATGSTMRAAAAALRQRSPARLIAAVPVAPPETVRRLEPEVDEVVCLATPEPFYAVGLWYERFGQTSDEEIVELLSRAERERAGAER